MFESGAIFGDVLDVLNKMKEHFDLVYSIWNGHYGDKLCSTPAYSKEFKPRFMQWCEVRALYYTRGNTSLDNARNVILSIRNTALNSSRTRTLFFCFGFFVNFCQTKRNNQQRKKPEVSMDISCGWRDPVKKPLVIMCTEYRKTRGKPSRLWITEIPMLNIQYLLPIPTQKCKSLSKNSSSKNPSRVV
jgi:hypothetical protein